MMMTNMKGRGTITSAVDASNTLSILEMINFVKINSAQVILRNKILNPKPHLSNLPRKPQEGPTILQIIEE